MTRMTICKRLILFALVAMLLMGSVLTFAEFALAPLEAQGGITVFANLRANNFYRALPRTSIAVSNNSAVNPTGTYTRLTAAAAVGTSGANITVEPAGTILVLVNVGSNTITFTETGTLKSAGNIALGATDTAMLVSDGTNWTQVAGSNN